MYKFQRLMEIRSFLPNYPTSRASVELLRSHARGNGLSGIAFKFTCLLLPPVSAPLGRPEELCLSCLYVSPRGRPAEPSTQQPSIRMELHKTESFACNLSILNGPLMLPHNAASFQCEVEIPATLYGLPTALHIGQPLYLDAVTAQTPPSLRELLAVRSSPVAGFVETCGPIFMLILVHMAMRAGQAFVREERRPLRGRRVRRLQPGWSAVGLTGATKRALNVDQDISAERHENMPSHLWSAGAYSTFRESAAAGGSYLVRWWPEHICTGAARGVGVRDKHSRKRNVNMPVNVLGIVWGVRGLGKSRYAHISVRLCSSTSPEVETVHDTIVTIQEVNGLCHDFLICFLYSPDLPMNHALMRLYPEFNLEGRVVGDVEKPAQICHRHGWGCIRGFRSFVRFLKLARSFESHGKSIPEDMPTRMHHQFDQTPVQSVDEQDEKCDLRMSAIQSSCGRRILTLMLEGACRVDAGVLIQDEHPPESVRAGHFHVGQPRYQDDILQALPRGLLDAKRVTVHQNHIVRDVRDADDFALIAELTLSACRMIPMARAVQEPDTSPP
ncbi:hypothetical protein FA95DRAFT_1575817 [Auriscalpium vulgare]|uniref:Uncharacterized protein n=1 Tax=Auriscalpium vulgare TaxID=40419 RepID=A0ACB8RE81_9AGAM|nr:hypothetical protein FA95DRAFT_1575817 [Auriscalpium vulgare]